MTPRDCQQALSTLFRGTLPLSCGLIYLSGTIDISLTVPLRTQRQLNTEFDPLLSLVNRKFCGGGELRGEWLPMFPLSCRHPPSLSLPLHMEHTQVYASELVRHFLTVSLCKRHWDLLVNTENAKQKGSLHIWVWMFRAEWTNQLCIWFFSESYRKVEHLHMNWWILITSR